MSVDDYGTGAHDGQDEKSADLGKIGCGGITESVKAQIRMSLGAITAEDIWAAYKISIHTVSLWEKEGLESFRPGTRERLYLRRDVEEFFSRKLTIQGKSKIGKRSSNDRRKKEKGPPS